MSDKKWQTAKKAPADLEQQFPEYSPQMRQLFYNRDLTTEKDVNEFLHPDYDQDLYDPQEMKGIPEAVERISQAIAAKKKILVFGDYDADGVTGALLMMETLTKLGAQTEVYIPSRQKEGYGLNTKALEKFKKKNIDLIITVDTGIRSEKEVVLANDMGIEVIVTDHHQVPDKIPAAAVVINPKQPGDDYPYKDLAGVGVAFKLARALGVKKLKPGWEKWLLDLVAIGTIADISSLMGENRTLVKYGLLVLNKTKRSGLQELIKKAGLEIGQLDAYNVAFQLAPRLNAAGRLTHAQQAYDLLAAPQQDTAARMAEELNKTNQLRQSLTKEVANGIEGKLGVIKGRKIVTAWNKEWPVGVCGLVAADLSERFQRPFFIISEGEGESRGSARSVVDFDVTAALTSCNHILTAYGGHKAAGGFTVANDKLPKLRQCLESYAEDHIDERKLKSVLPIDMELPTASIDWPLVRDIDRFQPFGVGNQKPVFVTRGLEVVSCSPVGQDEKHLKLRLAAAGQDKLPKVFSVIAFGYGQCQQELAPGTNVDVVYELDINTWNGNEEIQMRLVDYKVNK